MKHEVVRNFMFGSKNGFTFSVCKLTRDGMTFNWENILFDKQFEKKNESSGTTKVDSEFIDMTLTMSFPVQPINSIVDHKLDMVFEINNNEMAIQESTKCYKSAEFEETKYTGYVKTDYRYESAIIVVTPCSTSPSFVVVTDSDIDMLDGSTMSEELLDIVAGTSGNIDSRNFKFDIEKIVSKFSKDRKLDSPLYDIRNINLFYKDEYVEYDGYGNVVSYKNTKTGIEYLRTDYGDYIEHLISSKGVILKKTFVMRDKYEVIYMDAMNCTAVIVPNMTGPSKAGAIYFDDNKGDYIINAISFTGEGVESCSIEDKALELLRTLKRPAFSFEDDDNKTLKTLYENNTYSLSTHTATDNILQANMSFYGENDTPVYSETFYNESVSQDAIPTFLHNTLNAEKFYDTESNSICVITNDSKSKTREVDMVYNYNGLAWKMNCYTLNNVPIILKDYEDSTVEIHGSRLAKNHVLRDPKNIYIRGVYGIPHKYDTSLMVQELL